MPSEVTDKSSWAAESRAWDGWGEQSRGRGLSEGSGLREAGPEVYEPSGREKKARGSHRGDPGHAGPRSRQRAGRRKGELGPGRREGGRERAGRGSRRGGLPRPNGGDAFRVRS